MEIKLIGFQLGLDMLFKIRKAYYTRLFFGNLKFNMNGKMKNHQDLKALKYMKPMLGW